MAIPDYTQQNESSESSMQSGMGQVSGHFRAFVQGELRSVRGRPPAIIRENCCYCHHFYDIIARPVRWVTEYIIPKSVRLFNNSGPIRWAIKFFEWTTVAMLKVDGISEERAVIDQRIHVVTNQKITIHSDVLVGCRYVEGVRMASTYREVSGLAWDYNLHNLSALARYIKLKDEVDAIDKLVSALNNKVFGRRYKFALGAIGLTFTLTASFFYYKPAILPAAIGAFYIIGAVKGVVTDYLKKKSALGNFFQHEKNKKVLEILNNRRQENSRDIEIAQSGRMP